MAGYDPERERYIREGTGGEIVEFQEVMRQWRRMCNSSMSTCDDCPLRDYAFMGDNESCDAIYTDWAGNMDNKDWEMLEHAVMSWAAENPEPVYPRWVDWLMEQGIIPDAYAVEHSTEPGVRVARFFVTIKGFEPIPADIAQKLGIEPKEG